VAFELSYEKPLRRGTVELERRFWEEIATAVAQSFTGGGRRVAKAVSRQELTIRGVPGTRVRGLGQEPLLIGESGATTLEVLLPATFSYRATRTGYYPVQKDLYLETGPAELDLGQARGARWSIDAYLFMVNYPGLDVAYYPVPGIYWVKLGFHTFLLGFVLAEERNQSMLVSYSLSHLNFSTGVYFNAPDRLFRFYAGAGVFARIMTAEGLALEPIAPWGLQPILGMEISRNLKRRFYLEYAPLIYWPTNPSLFWLSLPLDSRPPILPIPWQEGTRPVVFWDILVFRLGVRWLL
jgi:hypothetical protein